MIKLEFGPGEEKLAQMAGLIQAAQEGLFAMTRRSEIDAMLIAALAQQVESPSRLLSTWQAMLQDYYPQQAVADLGMRETAPLVARILRERTDFWTRLIEQLQQTRD
jgi:hypothetical protein